MLFKLKLLKSFSPMDDVVLTRVDNTFGVEVGECKLKYSKLESAFIYTFGVVYIKNNFLSKCILN